MPGTSVYPAEGIEAVVVYRPRVISSSVPRQALLDAVNKGKATIVGEYHRDFQTPQGPLSLHALVLSESHLFHIIRPDGTVSREFFTCGHVADPRVIVPAYAKTHPNTSVDLRACYGDHTIQFQGYWPRGFSHVPGMPSVAKLPSKPLPVVWDYGAIEFGGFHENELLQGNGYIDSVVERFMAALGVRELVENHTYPFKEGNTVLGYTNIYPSKDGTVIMTIHTYAEHGTMMASISSTVPISGEKMQQVAQNKEHKITKYFLVDRLVEKDAFLDVHRP